MKKINSIFLVGTELETLSITRLRKLKYSVRYILDVNLNIAYPISQDFLIFGSACLL